MYSTVDANNNPIKINHNELNKRFIKKDYTVEAGALKLSGGFSKIGLQGTPYDFSEALNSYEGLMTTRDGFMHLINKPFGTMKISFAQALQGGDSKLVGEMMGALNSIGGVDIDGDGNPDQITQQNYKKLADILINPDAANFSVAKRAAAAFYADNDGRAQHQKGLDIRSLKQNELNKKNNQKESKNPERLGWQYDKNVSGFDSEHPDENKRTSYRDLGYGELVKNRNSLINKNEFQGNHYVYKFNGKTWQAFYENKFVKNVKGSDIAGWEGLLSPIDVMNGETVSFFNVGTRSAQNSEKAKEEAPEFPGAIGLNSIKNSSVEQVGVNIQNILSDQFSEDFTIGPVYKTTYSPSQKTNVSRLIKNQIKIIGNNFEKIYNIGPNATVDIAKQITEDFSDYVKPDPLRP